MITSPSVVSQMMLCPGYRVSEVQVPKALVDLSIDHADIAGRFGVTVVALQRGSNVIPMPKKSTVLLEDDYLVVIGADEAVHKLSNHV